MNDKHLEQQIKISELKKEIDQQKQKTTAFKCILAVSIIINLYLFLML